jgi:hypothetical protein
MERKDNFLYKIENVLFRQTAFLSKRVMGCDSALSYKLGYILVPVEEVGKGHWRVNIEQILCTHVCKWKNDTC